jgi:hypothetical protein
MNYLPHISLNMFNIKECFNKYGNFMLHSQEAAEENEKRS